MSWRRERRIRPPSPSPGLSMEAFAGLRRKPPSWSRSLDRLPNPLHVRRETDRCSSLPGPPTRSPSAARRRAWDGRGPAPWPGPEPRNSLRSRIGFPGHHEEGPRRGSPPPRRRRFLGCHRSRGWFPGGSAIPSLPVTTDHPVLGRPLPGLPPSDRGPHRLDA